MNLYGSVSDKAISLMLYLNLALFEFLMFSKSCIWCRLLLYNRVSCFDM